MQSGNKTKLQAGTVVVRNESSKFKVQATYADVEAAPASMC